MSQNRTVTVFLVSLAGAAGAAALAPQLGQKRALSGIADWQAVHVMTGVPSLRVH
jgi:hypothetical protein